MNLRNLGGVLLGATASMAVSPGLAVEKLASISAPCDVYIEGGEASKTLTEVGPQCDINIIFLAEDVSGELTRPVSGTASAREVVLAMLDGTNLVAVKVKDNTIAVGTQHFVTEIQRTSDDLQPYVVLIREEQKPLRPPARLAEVFVWGNRLRQMESAVLQSVNSAQLEKNGATTAESAIQVAPGTAQRGKSSQLSSVEQSNSVRQPLYDPRGLGADATLILIDSKPVAASVVDGSSADVGNMPLVAIERIDIGKDAGALKYGEVIGGVVNISTRKAFDGFETQLQRGGSGNGSLGDIRLAQIVGMKWGHGNGLVAAEGYEREPLNAREREQATSDLRGFNGDNFNKPHSTLFTQGHSVALSSEALDTLALRTDTANYYERYADVDIVDGEKRASVFAHIHQALNEQLDVHFDALVTGRRARGRGSHEDAVLTVTSRNPFYRNPLEGSGDPVQIAYSFGDELGAVESVATMQARNFTLGADLSHGSGWKSSAYIRYSAESRDLTRTGRVSLESLASALNDPDPKSAFDAFSGSSNDSTVIDGIRSSSHTDTRSARRLVGLSTSGELFRFFGAPATLEAGATLMEERATSSASGADAAPLRRLSRTTAAVYGELGLPLVGGSNDEGLTLYPGMRVERNDDGSYFHEPRIILGVFAAHGLGFYTTLSSTRKALSLVDLVSSEERTELVPLSNAPGGPGASLLMIRTGIVPSLQDETATRWSTGGTWTPSGFLKGLFLHLNVFDVRSRHRPVRTILQGNLLTSPEFASSVIHDPTTDQCEAARAGSRFVGIPVNCSDLVLDASVDLRTRNLYRSHNSGVELNATYRGITQYGQLDLQLAGTYLLDFSVADSADSGLVSKLNTQGNPLKLRWKGSAEWTRGGWDASLGFTYANAYRDTASWQPRRVGSWVAMDLGIGYEWPASTALAGVRAGLNIENLLDRSPPFLNGQVGIGYDQINADIRGRSGAFSLRKKW